MTIYWILFLSNAVTYWRNKSILGSRHLINNLHVLAHYYILSFLKKKRLKLFLKAKYTLSIYNTLNIFCITTKAALYAKIFSNNKCSWKILKLLKAYCNLFHYLYISFSYYRNVFFLLAKTSFVAQNNLDLYIAPTLTFCFLSTMYICFIDHWLLNKYPNIFYFAFTLFTIVIAIALIVVCAKYVLAIIDVLLIKGNGRASDNSEDSEYPEDPGCFEDTDGVDLTYHGDCCNCQQCLKEDYFNHDDCDDKNNNENHDGPCHNSSNEFCCCNNCERQVKSDELEIRLAKSKEFTDYNFYE